MDTKNTDFSLNTEDLPYGGFGENSQKANISLINETKNEEKQKRWDLSSECSVKEDIFSKENFSSSLLKF